MIDHLLVPTGAGPRPPADGFDRVLRGARRRRWRTLRNNAVCGTAAAAVIAVAASPHLTSGSVSGLEPAAPGVRRTYAGEPRSVGGGATPSPRAETSPTFAPGASADADGGGYGAANAGGPLDGTGTAPRQGVATSPGAPSPTPSAMDGGSQVYGPPASTGTDVPTPTAVPTVPTPGPTSPAPNPPPQEPIDQGYEDQSVSAPCEASTWCLSAQVLGATSDGIRTLKLSACRAASDTSGAIHLTTENEADFRILRDGRVLWQWSVGEPDPKYVHDVLVDRWQCATWTTPWYVTDQDGYAAEPGRYQLDAMSRATNVSTAWQSATFDVT